MEQPKRGFACGDNAARAARKNHALGTAHKFNSDTGSSAGRTSAERRWGSERRIVPRSDHDRRQSV